MASSDEKLSYYSKLLDDLKTFENEKPEEELDGYRRKVCGLEKDNETNNLDTFRQDLENADVELAEKVCKLIADLAKDETCRDKFIEKGFFPIVNKHLEVSLKVPLDNEKVLLLKIQICRAIGNLCYYCDNGRMSFLNTCGEKGLQNLIDLCRECIELDPSSTSESQRTFVTVVLGCIHNLTNENETLRKAVYATPLMSLIKRMVPFLKSSPGVRVHFVSLVENLIELDEGKKQFVDEEVALKLYESFDQNFMDDLDQDCLEDFFDFLSNINELEKSKDFLCKTEFLKIVLETAEKHASEEEVMRHFGLFLVKLVVQDDKIDGIFAYKDGLVLNSSIEWLSKFRSEQLYVTSAVLMANYMRSDDKVMDLIKHKSEPHKKLIQLLSTYANSAKTASLQQTNVSHSLLGSVRNFCVCQPAREPLVSVEPRIVDVTVRFVVDSENYEILFKSLSILRFLIRTCSVRNGLEAVFADETLRRFEHIHATVEHHAGVRNELSRLLCLMPLAGASRAEHKHLFDRLGQHKTIVDIICNQLSSEHFIMLNEALIAINILVTVDYRLFREHLKSSSLHKNLTVLLKNEKLPIEMKINSLKLYKTLFDKNDFFDQEQLAEYLSVLKQLKLSISTDFIRTQIDQLISSLENATI